MFINLFLNLWTWLQHHLLWYLSAFKLMLGGHHFLWNGGAWISKSALAIFLWPPHLMIKNFMTPPPELQCWRNMYPPMCVAWKICNLRAISLNQIFIKICNHPIISWFFWGPPYFSWKNSVTPSFFMTPSIQKKMIAPLIMHLSHYCICSVSSVH